MKQSGIEKQRISSRIPLRSIRATGVEFPTYGRAGSLLRPNHQVFELPVEGRQAHAERFCGAFLVTLDFLEHAFDMAFLIGLHGVFEVVTQRRHDHLVWLDPARQVSWS